MKFNGATFNKAQQDQLKKKVGAELDEVTAKVDDVDSRMLNYTGDWVTGNEYHENDVVTWAHDGHLYEVIKAHTSSTTLDPDNPEYYKPMTASKMIQYTYNLSDPIARSKIIALGDKFRAGKKVYAYIGRIFYYITFYEVDNCIRFAMLQFSEEAETLYLNSLEINPNIARQASFWVTKDGNITSHMSNFDSGQTMTIFVET